MRHCAGMMWVESGMMWVELGVIWVESGVVFVFVKRLGNDRPLVPLIDEVPQPVCKT